MKSAPGTHVSFYWGWMNPDKSIQQKVFSSASAAIEEMCERLTIEADSEDTLDTIESFGFRLAYLKQILTVARVLSVPQPEESKKDID